MGIPTSFKLSEIADWQLAQKSNITLPEIQRGFVWSSLQIENLWDSILRGYPIGTFLLKEISETQYYLLDGQQRATAIALGLHNPWLSDKSKFWKIDPNKLPIMWIDLMFNGGKLAPRFRLISKAYPWGHQIDGKQFKAEERRNALIAFKSACDPKNPNPNKDSISKYYNLDLKFCWPWQTQAPLPFAFFWSAVETDSKKVLEVLYSSVQKHLGHLPSYALKQIQEIFSHHQDQIYNLCQKILSLRERRKIPVEVFSSTDDETTPQKEDKLIFPSLIPSISDEDQSSQDSREEMEILFERFNKGGTTLDTEEWMFSIYKSLFPCFSDIGEKCKYIKPSRIINLAVKLTLAIGSGKQPPQKIKIIDFKQYLTHGDFKKTLESIVADIDNEAAPFQMAAKILSGTEELHKSWQIPYFLLCDLAKDAPDVLLILLIRLRQGDGEAILEDDDLHRRIIGFITTLAWFAKRPGKTTIASLGAI